MQDGLGKAMKVIPVVPTASTDALHILVFFQAYQTSEKRRLSLMEDQGGLALMLKAPERVATAPTALVGARGGGLEARHFMRPCHVRVG